MIAGQIRQLKNFSDLLVISITLSSRVFLQKRRAGLGAVPGRNGSS
jgi:hypothetical protein